MRTLVLVAGVLLLVSLGIFLAVGKGKNPFNRRDLPQRLGVEIQQEGNGVTYTQAHGGKTLIKIHATKVVQYKQGTALLHDVKIELYGEDGSRVDRIESNEFLYDQKTGIAVASGPVEITLMRPGVAPAIATKAAAGHAVSEKLKGAPVASVAEAAERGEIHVKTSGLTFDQKSGEATTSQHVDFSMAQGAGSSMGARYDSQEGILLLDRAVELTTRRGTETVHIHAQHAEFERVSQLCRLSAATVDYQGGDASAGEALILFRADGSADRLDAMDGFTLATADGGHLAAPIGEMEFDEHNQPRHGHLAGGVTMNSVSEVAGGRRQVHGSAPTADLGFDARGQLRKAHLEEGVAMDSEELSEHVGQPQRLSRHWRSPIADVEFRTSSHGQTEPSVVRGWGGVVVTGESQRGNGAIAPSRLSADEVTGKFGPDAVITSMSGAGHASMEETTATGTRQSTSGDRLEAYFPLNAATVAKGGQTGAPPVQSASVVGHVVLMQISMAKPGAAAAPSLRATAGRADYEGQGEWMHLSGTPRVEDCALELTANRVDVSRATGDAFAHGNVKASWMNAGAAGNEAPTKPSGSDPGKGRVAFGGQGPAHVVAAEAQLRHAVGGSSGTVTFSGAARLWQQGNSVAAPVIVLDREQQTLVAITRDAAEPVRAVLVSAAGTATGKAQTRGNRTSVIRMRGGDLRYSEVERKAVMRSGVLGTVVAETGSVTSFSDEVEVTLLPGGKADGKDGGQAQVEHVTARGHVVLTSEGRRGSGEQLVYTGATNEYVLTGTAAAPPRIFDPARGTITGEALIFHGRDDSVSAEGGSQKTTTETTAPK
jgi:lipopolysaccharide export system protein LptA